MIRISLFDRAGNSLGDLSEGDGGLMSCVRTEEINGEHSLSITTERHLDIGTVALYHDAGGRWHEFVLDEGPESHDSGPHAIGSYHFVWSLQYDLQAVCGEMRQPGMKSAANAETALRAALAGTSRWQIGSVTVQTKSGCIMAYDTAWDRLSAVVKYWGGEIDARIAASGRGVESRIVDLLETVGSSTVTRRFDWDHSLTSIKRTPDPGPYYCRIIPYGRGESEYSDDGETTYEDKITIARKNGGRIYLEDSSAAKSFRVKVGGSEEAWEYPTCIVDYATDDEAELIQLAKADLYSHTRPSVSYEGTVSQFAAAGMNVLGIRLGDEVQVVDKGFNADAPLRIQARVLRMEIDELGVDDIKLSIGRLNHTLEKTMAATIKAVGTKTIVAEMPNTAADIVPVPTLPTYEVTNPSTGETKAITTTKRDALSYTPAASYDMADLESRLRSLESGGVSGGSYSGGGGDGWTHMIDGSVVGAGTIDFVTGGAWQEYNYGDYDPEEWGE